MNYLKWAQRNNNNNNNNNNEFDLKEPFKAFKDTTHNNSTTKNSGQCSANENKWVRGCNMVKLISTLLIILI